MSNLATVLRQKIISEYIYKNFKKINNKAELRALAEKHADKIMRDRIKLATKKISGNIWPQLGLKE